MSEPLKKRKKLFVNILSSDAPYVNQDGHTRTNTKKWLARREFNPFIHRAWLLLGKAQYQKGDFPEAASTFSYIVRLYDGQTNITSGSSDLAILLLLSTGLAIRC